MIAAEEALLRLQEGNARFVSGDTDTVSGAVAFLDGDVR
jgi:hypothetical protein